MLHWLVGYRGSSFRKHTKLTLAASIFLLSPYACFAQTDIPKLPNPGNTSISHDDQVKLGFQASQELYKQLPLLPDSSPETQYVRQIGKRLVAAIPTENSWPFDFHVVAQKEINAFALPGGEMFVNLGTLVAAQNDAQLAGVMAHEMAHVYMQHSAKQMQKAQLTQGLAGLAGAILGNKGTLGSLGQMGVQVGAGMAMLKYSRGDEAQADEVGAMILQRARYNPQALADFFKTLEAQGGTGPQFLSDHPNPGNREAAIKNEIAGWPPVKYQTDLASFTKARQHATGVKAYSAEEIAQGAKAGQWEALNKNNGVVLTAPAGVSPSTASQTKPDATTTNAVSWNDVMPSSKFVLVDIGHLQMVRPANWTTVAPKKEGDSITIAPRAGVVSNGIGYGVVINEVSPTDKNATIDQTTTDIVRSLQSSGNLQPLDKVTEITVAGVRGRSVNLQSTSPFTDSRGQSQKERDRLVTIPHPDGSVVYFVFIAPESQFNNLVPTYDRMLKSVQF